MCRGWGARPGLGRESLRSSDPAGEALDIETLRAWGKERLAPYKVPKDLALLEKLPRNAMGKIIKPDVKKIIQGSE
jgi:acyl-coenzyme A synthetase/AMP-(fatty) acid ligase